MSGCMTTGARAGAGAFFLAALLFGFSAAVAQDYTPPREMDLPAPGFERPDPEPLRLTLPNELAAYVVEDHTVPLVTLSAFVGAGTADHAREGAAEVLARALRRGPAGMTPEQFSAALEEMAAEFRVEMGVEETEITLDVSAEDAERALDLLAGLLREPALAEGDIVALRDGATRVAPSAAATGESGPVLYEGSLDAATDLFRQRLFEDHPYGRTPTAEDAAALTLDGVRDFHRTQFVPVNTVLAVAGDFDAARMRSAVERVFGDWPRAPRPERAVAPEVRTPAPRTIATYPSDKLQAWVVIGHELPRVPVEEEAALDVMNYILGGGHFDTRLFRETRDLRGLTNDASGFLEPNLRGPGTYTFRTYGRPEVVPLLVHLVMEGVEQIREEPVSEEELFVAKGALGDGVYELRFRNGFATARTFAREWLRYGDHRHSATYPERVRAVSAADVLAAAREYLHPERMQMVVVGPIDEVREAPSLEGEPALDAFGEVVGGR